MTNSSLHMHTLIHTYMYTNDHTHLTTHPNHTHIQVLCELQCVLDGLHNKEIEERKKVCDLPVCVIHDITSKHTHINTHAYTHNILPIFVSLSLLSYTLRKRWRGSWKLPPHHLLFLPPNHFQITKCVAMKWLRGRKSEVEGLKKRRWTGKKKRQRKLEDNEEEKKIRKLGESSNNGEEDDMKKL